MPKGSIIVRMTVTDPDAYETYAAMASRAMKTHGIRPRAGGGRSQGVEGESRPRNVVLEAESYEAALAYDHSPEDQAAVAMRKPAGIGEVVIVEGADQRFPGSRFPAPTIAGPEGGPASVALRCIRATAARSRP